MAFGIPGSNEGTGTGPFLARVQYDARSGFFTNVDRVQGADGRWTDSAGEPYRNLVAAFDFGSMEVGYIKFAAPPSFVVVPYLGDATVFPAQPQEMTQPDKDGKTRKAFQPGFRMKLMGKVFGDGEPRYFAHTAKGVMGTMQDLYSAYIAAPEAAQGLIPVCTHSSTKTIETSGPRGTTKNFAPVWTITAWVPRPEGFGDRTVPAPMPRAAAPQPSQAPSAPPARHVPPPVAAAPEPVREEAVADLPF